MYNLNRLNYILKRNSNINRYIYSIFDQNYNLFYYKKYENNENYNNKFYSNYSIINQKQKNIFLFLNNSYDIYNKNYINQLKTRYKNYIHDIFQYHPFSSYNNNKNNKIKNNNEINDGLSQKYSNQKHKKQEEKSRKLVFLSLGGNLAITIAKFLSYLYSGSSAMLSEAIHSLVDSGNQALLLVGLKSASIAADKHFQYGYGKSVYFWSLVSALGTFWLGAGVSLRNSIGDILNPSFDPSLFTPDTWAVLLFSFVIDGNILARSLSHAIKSKPKNISLWKHLNSFRDPTTLAILLEDAAACTGVLMAMAGIGASSLTNNPMWDSLAGVGISCLLAGMGLTLARLSYRSLLGRAVEPDIIGDIKEILEVRPAIDAIYSIQSQWIGPNSFAFKAEVDFDGTYLAAKLMSRYSSEFRGVVKGNDKDLEVLLSWYAEDVMRTVELEVREAESEIRKKYPEAEFIELEPDSRESSRYALPSKNELSLWTNERKKVDEMLRALNVLVTMKKVEEKKKKEKELKLERENNKGMREKLIVVEVDTKDKDN